MALIVALFLAILLALPVYVLLAGTGLAANPLAFATIGVVGLGYALLYRHVKGAWFGWMVQR